MAKDVPNIVKKNLPYFFLLLLLQIKETNENLQEDEEDTIADSAFQSHIIGKNSRLDTSLAEIFSM